MLSCDEMKNVMLEFIYGELPEDRLQAFETHLAGCTACREELVGLQKTSETLAQWPDAVPLQGGLFPSSQALPWRQTPSGWWRSLPPLRKLVLALPAAAMLILLALAAMNTHISVEQGQWQMSLSLRPQPAPLPQDAVVLTKAEFIALEQQRWQVIQSMLRESQEDQRQEWVTAMTKLSRYVEQQRKQDLLMINSGLQSIGEQTASRFAYTDQVLTEVIKLAYNEQYPQQ